MPAAPKVITIEQAKAQAAAIAAAKAKAEEEKKNPPPPPIETGPSIDPPPDILEREEQELLKKYEAMENEPDPDIVAAEKTKAQITAEKSKTKTQKLAEMPSRANRERTSHGKKWKTRPCAMCKNPHEFGDPRSKYCPVCAKIVSAQAALEGWWRPELVQKDIEEKLRPFLRIGLNLKEACLEAEIDYGNILEKKKIWQGFSDFIERHQNYQIIKAKKNVYEINAGGKENIYGPKEIARTSRWLLERRRPNEYGPRVNLTGTVVAAELDTKKKALMGALLAATLWQLEPPDNDEEDDPQT